MTERLHLDRRTLLTTLAATGLFSTPSTGTVGMQNAASIHAVESTDQSSTIHWEWTDEGDRESAIQGITGTGDGSVVVTGFLTDGDAGQDVSFWELDLDDGEEVGSQIWRGDGNDAVLDVTTTDAGEVVFCGGSATRDSDLLDTSAGVYRTESEDIEWFESQGSEETNDAAHAIVSTADGYVLAGGTQYLGGADGGGTGRLVGLDTDGNARWNETYTSDAGEIYDIIETDGGYVFGGTRAVDDGGNAWVGLVDDDGTLEWDETFGGAGNRTIYSLSEAHTGGYVFAGTTTPPGREEPLAWVGVIDPDGTLLWEETYGTTGGTAAFAIERTPGEQYLITGYTTESGSEDGWLLQIDDTGSVTLEETYATDEDIAARFNALEQVNGGYVAGGVKIEPESEPSAWLLYTDGPTSELIERLQRPTEEISSVLETHIQERREHVLEPGFEKAAGTLDSTIEIDLDGDDLVETLVSATTDEVTIAANEAANENFDPDELDGALKGVAVDLTIDGGEELAFWHYLVGSVADRLDNKAEERGERFEQYISDLCQRDWFLSPYAFDPDEPTTDYTELNTYTTSKQRARELVDDITTLGSQVTPADLNTEHVHAVFLQLEATLTDPAGIGSLERQSSYPTDLIILPDGTVLNTGRGTMTLAAIQTTVEAYEETGGWDILGTIAGITGWLSAGAIVVGGVLAVIPEPTTTAAGAALIAGGKKAGWAASKAGIVADLAQSYEDLTDYEAILGRHIELHLDALSDIDNLGRVANGVERWLDDQYDNPTVGEVDGDIWFPDGFETTPDDPLEPTEEVSDEMELVSGEITVGFDSTGDATVPGRILGFSSYFGGGAGDSELPVLQGFVVTEPPADEEPEQFTATDRGQRDIKYAFHHPVEDQFRQHLFNVHLVLEGRHVDTDTAVADVRDESGLLELFSPSPAPAVGERRVGSGLSTAQRTPYTTVDTPSSRSMTADELDELRGETTVLTSETLESGESTSTSITVSGENRSTAVSLLFPPGTDPELEVTDGAGTAVAGGDMTTSSLDIDATVEAAEGVRQVTAFPSQDTELNIDVGVPQDEPRPVSITLLKVDTPERPPVLGVKPTQLELFSRPGEKIDTRIVITEVGNQQPVENLVLTSQPLVNADGTEIATENISVESVSQHLEPSENGHAALTFETPERSEFTDEPTRFNGSVNIESDSTSDLSLPVSLLVLDTDVEDARLVAADRSVTRVALDELPQSEVEANLPENTQTVYRLTVESQDEATISVRLGILGDFTQEERVVPLQLRNDTFEQLDATGERIEFESGEHIVAITVQSVDSVESDSGGEDDDSEFLLSQEELAGASVVSLSLLYLAVRMLSDDE